jgi:hypothetical protein
MTSPADGGPARLLCRPGAIATWAGKNSKGYVDSKALLGGAPLRLKDGSFPALALATLTHPDRDVPGRQWATEVGLRQATPDSPIECSVFLKTHEIGTGGVNHPIQVTRPYVVEDNCLQAVGRTYALRREPSPCRCGRTADSSLKYPRQRRGQGLDSGRTDPSECVRGTEMSKARKMVRGRRENRVKPSGA